MTSSVDTIFSLRVTAKIYSSEEYCGNIVDNYSSIKPETHVTHSSNVKSFVCECLDKYWPRK